MIKKLIFTLLYFVLFIAGILLISWSAEAGVNYPGKGFPIVHFTIFVASLIGTLAMIIFFLSSWEGLFESEDQDN